MPRLHSPFKMNDFLWYADQFRRNTDGCTHCFCSSFRDLFIVQCPLLFVLSRAESAFRVLYAWWIVAIKDPLQYIDLLEPDFLSAT